MRESKEVSRRRAKLLKSHRELDRSRAEDTQEDLTVLRVFNPLVRRQEVPLPRSVSIPYCSTRLPADEIHPGSLELPE